MFSWARMSVMSLVAAALASGCCAFFPCHPSSRVVGVVRSDGKAVAGAKVSLFSSTQTTDSTGCFYFNLPSALPLTLAVSADGYEPVVSPAEFGLFRVTVDLAALGSTSQFPNSSPCT